MKLVSLFAAALAVPLLLAGSTQAAVILGNAADVQVGVASAGFSNPTDDDGATNALGDGVIIAGDPFDTKQVSVFVFQLPNLGAVANPFLTASATITTGSNTNNPFQFSDGNYYDLYGLGARATSAIAGSDFFIGASDGTDATIIQNDLLTNSQDGGNNGLPAGTAVTTGVSGSANLLGYLNAQYASGAGAGQFVFLRINADFTNTHFGRYSFQSASSVSLGSCPRLLTPPQSCPNRPQRCWA